MIIGLSGCIQAKADPRYPTFNNVLKPQLYKITKEEVSCLKSPILERILFNDQALKIYIQKREAQINAYMKWVRDQGQKD